MTIDQSRIAPWKAGSALRATETDPWGAYVPHGRIEVPGSGAGPLAGLRFAAKDSFDVAGVPTGQGNPAWLASHAIPAENSPSVQLLLDAGARLVGKTRMDELGYSISGVNVHYGTPLNPLAPDRTPGGSSSGSATVVAAGVVPFSLAADGGGSVRTPASYCGILGIRPSHGRVADSTMGSTATVGWFASTAELLEQVGSVLLSDYSPGAQPGRVLIAEDLFGAAEPGVREAAAPAIALIEDAAGRAESISLAEGAIKEWRETFREVQAAENWASLGAWISTERPEFGPDIADRFARAQLQPTSTTQSARERRTSIRARLNQVLADGAVLIAPSAAGAAPLRTATYEELEKRRSRAFQLLCPAGLGGLAQISLPSPSTTVRRWASPSSLRTAAMRCSSTSLLGS